MQFSSFLFSASKPENKKKDISENRKLAGCPSI